MYRFGETVLPVWPTWCPWPIQPASTAARDAPTAPPSESARSLRIVENGSGPPTPRPPEITVDASSTPSSPAASTTSSSTLMRYVLPAGFSSCTTVPPPALCAAFERVRTDRRDAVVALERARREHRAAELRGDARRFAAVDLDIDHVGGLARIETRGQTATEVATDHRVRYENQRGGRRPSPQPRDNRQTDR